ncbi:MAG TPA: branched-chain amino acid ABC transporter permease [Burkholderiaceae bacterium]|nr:branched-chain amino acid ABC transporter permease [Burkholderiaceae bacterium]
MNHYLDRTGIPAREAALARTRTVQPALLDRPTLLRLLPVALGFALLALFPLFGSSFYVQLAMKIMIFAIFALSLELLVGQTGLVCFGHAAFFGIAAYTVALMTPKDSGASLWLALPASLLAASAYALAVGALSLRTRGIYFIMITLAFAQMAYFVFHDTPVGGGSDGIYLYFPPEARIGPWKPFDLGRGLTLYYFVWCALILVFGLLAVMLRSRFGRALAGIKANEQRMRATGFETYRYKLGAFVLAAALAGLAGFLYALKDGVVNPEILSWHFSGAVLLMIILGGLGHLRGAMLGAVVLTLLEELFQSQAVFGAFAKHWQLMLGLTIIACVAVMPHGLIGLGGRKR